MEINPKLKDTIIYCFSFFCAGTPSRNANNKLLYTIGLKPEECINLNYRGNGWPGLTEAIDKNGKHYSMDYQTAWMDILGRDIRYCCKFCFDSIGENSDISCGDYWYLNNDNTPDFSERDGRNCVFAWSLKGKILFEKMLDDESVKIDKEPIDNLYRAQPNHFNRRSTLFTKLLIMKFAGREIPNFYLSELMKFVKFNSLLNQIRTAKGTIQRLKKRMI